MRSIVQRLPARPTTLRLLGAASGSPKLARLRFFAPGHRENSDFALVVRDQDCDGRSQYFARGINHIYESAGREAEAEVIGSWRNHLITYEQCYYESNLGGTSSKGIRLVDQDAFSSNFDLWLELIRFRRRHKDADGINAIWKKLLARKLHLPTQGATADELWDQFLRFGWETDSIADIIIPNAKTMKAATGLAWPKLYTRILGYCLKKNPQNSSLWHDLLHKDFPPSSEHLKELFSLAVSNRDALKAFRFLYMSLPNRDLYATIIPQLCSLQYYTLASRWHRLLMKVQDIPSTSTTVQPLLDHLVVYGNKNDLADMNKKMADAGVSLVPFNGQDFREILNRQLGQIHRIAPKVLSDEFCARLFATAMFSVDTIINGLLMLGVDAIGPLALRELVSREGSSPVNCRRRLAQLKLAGITVGHSTFSKLVCNLASQDKAQLLADVVNCEMHPDAFDDRKLQESLLTRYHEYGDGLKARRTLAILAAMSSPARATILHWNVMLRSALRRQDRVNVHKILEAMHEHQVPISAKSSSLVRVYMISRRQVARRPVTTRELPPIIAIFQRILRSGGTVPAYDWRDILRRLGMMGELIELEKLAIWLADWYSNPTACAAQSSHFHPRNKHIPRDLSPLHPQHPLRIIFPAAAQSAIIAWGFQHPGDIEQRVRQLRNRGLTWRWGLQLLRKLRGRGVPIARETVASACRLRLIALFRRGRSNRRINRRARARNAHPLEYYAEEIEKVWGKDVFGICPSLPRGHPWKLVQIKEMVMGEHMDGDADTRDPHLESQGS